MSSNIINLKDKRQKLKEAEEDDEVVFTAVIRKNGLVTVWLSGCVETKDQTEWLYTKIIDAIHCVRDLTKEFE